MVAGLQLLFQPTLFLKLERPHSQTVAIAAGGCWVIIVGQGDKAVLARSLVDSPEALVHQLPPMLVKDIIRLLYISVSLVLQF